jgi:threonine aldolase
VSTRPVPNAPPGSTIGSSRRRGEAEGDGDLDPTKVWAACERALGFPSLKDRDPRTALLALAERAPPAAEIDFYGEGALIESLEARVAGLLGKEAAAWMPSGTMAQQIALRIHAEQRGNRRIAFHPRCHLDEHEERGYEHLHALRARLLGDTHRLATADDVDSLREPVAAVLLELPQRELGGQLPLWDDLVELCDRARERGAALHLDGARLWQCGPFYGRGLDEIAGLFETVYVSFYKDLAAIAGAALAGPKELIDEARVWRVRHGGRLYSAHPFLLAADRGLDELLPLMPELVERARELAAALAGLDGVEVVPDPPHTAMFHLYVHGSLEPLRHASFEVSERTKTFLGNLRPTERPNVQRVELTIGTGSLEVPVSEARALWSEVLVVGRA